MRCEPCDGSGSGSRFPSLPTKRTRDGPTRQVCWLRCTESTEFQPFFLYKGRCTYHERTSELSLVKEQRQVKRAESSVYAFAGSNFYHPGRCFDGSMALLVFNAGSWKPSTLTVYLGALVLAIHLQCRPSLYHAIEDVQSSSHSTVLQRLMVNHDEVFETAINLLERRYFCDSSERPSCNVLDHVCTVQ